MLEHQLLEPERAYHWLPADADMAVVGPDGAPALLSREAYRQGGAQDPASKAFVAQHAPGAIPRIDAALEQSIGWVESTGGDVEAVRLLEALLADGSIDRRVAAAIERAYLEGWASGYSRGLDVHHLVGADAGDGGQAEDWQASRARADLEGGRR